MSIDLFSLHCTYYPSIKLYFYQTIMQVDSYIYIVLFSDSKHFTVMKQLAINNVFAN